MAMRPDRSNRPETPVPWRFLGPTGILSPHMADAKTPPRAGPGDPHVELRNVCKEFGDRTIFSDLSCTFPKDRITVVLGGSGSGKSTLVRLVAGLIEPESGSILIDGADITTLSPKEMAPVRRKLGMMFQHGALLDSMRVYDNLAFPLREHTAMFESEIAAEVRECLASVGLSDVDDLLPGELSGGMMKRVALARALIMKPVILLCDEPFSGLDPITTKRIEILLKKVNKELGITVIMISHDVASTMRMADQLLVMLPDGHAQGPPAELRNSSDPRVRNLLSEDVEESVIELEVAVEAQAVVRPMDLDSTWYVTPSKR